MQLMVQFSIIILLFLQIIINIAIIKKSLKDRALMFQMEYNKDKANY
jgi:hypothetical protein